MEHDNDWLAQALSDLGQVVYRTPHTGECVVDQRLGDYDVKVKVVLPDGFPATLPKFHLLERFKYGPLAHVSWGENGKAEICFGAPSAFNVDFDYPERVVEVSLSRAFEILSKVLNDDSYNEAELKREFVGVWNNCIQTGANSLMCMAEPIGGLEELEIRSKDTKFKHGVGAIHVATAKSSAVNDKHQWVRAACSVTRSNRGKGIFLDLPHLPIPPGPGESVDGWWANALLKQPDELLRKLKDYGRHSRSKEFFIVCRAALDDGNVWFGLHASRAAKERVPVHPDYLDGWSVDAIILQAVTRENLLPRAGSELGLQEASVCIVGAGSVGGYIADLLASSGVGHIELVDYDSFMLENTHRHYLSPDWLFQNKAFALCYELERKYPFVRCEYKKITLREWLKSLGSENYDLVISATGDQSQERYLNKFLFQNKIELPVIYTWVEAYGVGGHAVASIPGGGGCLNCIFSDNETGEKSLYPRIGFIEKGQKIISSHTGCGQEYVSYSNIDAVQTASIAAKSAIRVLNSEISESVYTSWKGDDSLVKKRNISLTHRYYRLTRPMEAIPIGSKGCEVCSPYESHDKN